MKYLNKILRIPGSILSEYEYEKWLYFINKSQWWSDDKLKEYQWKRIKLLLNHAYGNVPYYKNLFRELDATPSDFKDLLDFAKFPVLTKDILKSHIEDFFPLNINKKSAFRFTTGGSTGEPLSFYRQSKNDSIEKAFMHNQWSRIGFKKGDTRVIIRGEALENGRLWVQNSNGGICKFSTFRLDEYTIRTLVDKLNELKPDYLHVYPSALWIFMNLMKSFNLHINFKLRGILCGSENLPDIQRKFFEEFYSTTVFSWLGSAEQTILAGECEYSTDLHVFPMHSYVEIVPDPSFIQTDNTSTGEIIGTNLHNYVTPFIRYKTGDIATLKKKHCELCKREFPLILDVKGRKQWFLYDKTGNEFPVGPAIFGIHDDRWNDILKIQLVQETIGNVILRIVPKSEVEVDALKLYVAGIFKSRFSDRIDFEIIITDHTDVTKSGKDIFLIQKVTP